MLERWRSHEEVLEHFDMAAGLSMEATLENLQARLGSLHPDKSGGVFTSEDAKVEYHDVHDAVHYLKAELARSRHSNRLTIPASDLAVVVRELANAIATSRLDGQNPEIERAAVREAVHRRFRFFRTSAAVLLAVNTSLLVAGDSKNPLVTWAVDLRTPLHTYVLSNAERWRAIELGLQAVDLVLLRQQYAADPGAIDTFAFQLRRVLEETEPNEFDLARTNSPIEALESALDRLSRNTQSPRPETAQAAVLVVQAAKKQFIRQLNLSALRVLWMFTGLAFLVMWRRENIAARQAECLLSERGLELLLGFRDDSEGTLEDVPSFTRSQMADRICAWSASQRRLPLDWRSGPFVDAVAADALASHLLTGLVKEGHLRVKSMQRGITTYEWARGDDQQRLAGGEAVGP